MEKVAVLAITKNGVKIGLKLKEFFKSWQIYAPSKFSNNDNNIEWYADSTTSKIVNLFKTNDAIVCIFSLGAVIRLISPHIKDKKTDPAVIVIDDKTKFVISVLSGHLGGANKLTEEIAEKLGAISVVTTAADVNQTIAVDLLGREFGWKIEDDSTVTKVSAYMVNEEKIGIYQDAGEKNWWSKELPSNVTIYSTLEELKKSSSKGYLLITDKIIEEPTVIQDAVIYRPSTLVVGVGLHWDTPKDTIREGLDFCLKKYRLSEKSIAKFVTLKKEQDVQGLVELGREMKVPIEYFEREELSKITIPNPSDIVLSFEGTPSVSEAAALKGSMGQLIVEKQKFPPNLTIAIARISY
jgi:cobalt-precorrin 5A hydrolase